MFSGEIYDFFRSNHQRCFTKKSVLKNFALFTGKLQTCNFIKKKTQVFSSEYCEIFNNTYFEELVLRAAFDFLKQLQNIGEQLLL